MRVHIPVEEVHLGPRPWRLLRRRPRPSLFPRLRVLVVDDDPLLIQSLRDVMEGEGHEVTSAAGGQQALDLLRADGRRFDAVVTDLGMPHVDGRAVARATKAVSPETRVILLTGWGQKLLDEGEMPPGVDQVLRQAIFQSARTSARRWRFLR